MCSASALAAGVISQQFTVFTIPTAVIFFATIALAEGLEADAQAPQRFMPLAAPLLYLAFRYVHLDHEMALTARALAASDLTGAAAHYQASQNSGDLWYSRALLSMASRAATVPQRLTALRAADVAGLRATQSDEAPFNAWYSLSELRAAEGDAAGMEQALRNAINAHPNWFKPHWALAQLLMLEHRRTGAQTEARTAESLDAGKHPEVLQTLQLAKSL